MAAHTPSWPPATATIPAVASASPALTRDVLAVRFDGRITRGLMFLGLRECDAPGMPRFPWHVWSSGIRVDVTKRQGLEWEIVEWRVPMTEWPTGEAWQRAVSQTLSSLIASRCTVAWLSTGEGTVREPPELFLPELMHGTVLAAMTACGMFACAVDPDRPVASLTDADLHQLRLASAGLAEVV
jgi:hypothetical protein